MALYSGSSKCKVILNNVVYRLFIPTTSVDTSGGIRLLSSDNYILQDSNGVYLTAKDGE